MNEDNNGDSEGATVVHKKPRYIYVCNNCSHCKLLSLIRKCIKVF